jgi:hypothetical protein
MNPSKARIVSLTKRFSLFLILGTAFFLIKVVDLTAVSSTKASTQDRKFKKKEFVDMPVRVREVKNLQSETWPNDLEIEVENVSSKPVYFINAVLEFPDDQSGIILKYGNLENMDIRRIAKEEDEHLDPDKKTILVVSDVYKKGLLARQKNRPENFKKIELWFEIISFGDGTGFEVSQFLDLRTKQ